MSTPIELVPLNCARCETPIPAQPDEVVWSCARCGQGLLLDEDRGLAPLEIHYAAEIDRSAEGRPFWVSEGRVTLHRDTYSALGKKTEEAHTFWSHPRRFFVPAFACPLNTQIDLGTRMLLQPPRLEPGEPVHFAPVILSQQDVPALAEFIITAIEAQRSDKVKQVEFSLQLSTPELWILP